jgi:dTDP-4-amino-4,6-dideoxygalactose transaminase
VIDVVEDEKESKKQIGLWDVYVPDGAAEAVADILRSRWLNTGSQEALFIEKLRNRFGIPYCVAVNSGTSALRASLALLGVGSGDEVITTPYTFLATNTSILEQGATPVFADVRYDDCNIDPGSIEQKISKRTKAIICVHFAGNICDMDEIREIGWASNLPIIEDCAHALGSSYKGRYTGSISDIACFSFQAIKMITCADGGAIATTHEEYYHTLKKIIWFGVDRSSREPRLLDPLPDEIDTLGFKYNMNDVSAALGIAGIDHFDEIFQRRKDIGEAYRAELASLSKIRLMRYFPDRVPNYWIFPVHVQDRERFAQHMRRCSIQVNINNRRNDRYSIFGGIRELAVTEKVDKDVILIPLHQGLADEHVDRIIDAVKKYDRI